MAAFRTSLRRTPSPTGPPGRATTCRTCDAGIERTSTSTSRRAISNDRAQSLFEEMKALRNIPFDYPVDCCYTRAHVMARAMRKRGVIAGKVWYFAEDWGKDNGSRPLTPMRADGTPVTFFDADTSTDEPVTWRYHVAPLVDVQQPDGTIVPMVIDPSLADGPVTRETWQALMGSPRGAYEEITNRFPYFRNKKTKSDVLWDPDLSESKEQLKAHRSDRDAALAAKAARMP